MPDQDPRSLDDLTRDLRKRQSAQFSARGPMDLLVVAPFLMGGDSAPDPLSQEAADAIDNLRAPARCTESANIVLKTMFAALRPLFKAHRLSDTFKAPGGRECVCGKLVADVDGWVEHVMTILALGDEPPDPKERAAPLLGAVTDKLEYLRIDGKEYPIDSDLTPLVDPKFVLCRAYHSRSLHGPCSNCGSAWVLHDISAKPPAPVDWRSVPVTAGMLFDALGRVDAGRDGIAFSLSCEIERAARAIAGGGK